MHFPSQRPLHARARSSSTWRIASPRCALRGQARRFERSFNFTQGRHACGKDQRLAESSNVTQVRQIGDLTGGYLQTAHAQFHEQIDALRVTSGGEKLKFTPASAMTSVFKPASSVIRGVGSPLRPTCPLPCLTDTKESFRCEIAAC